MVCLDLKISRINREDPSFFGTLKTGEIQIICFILNSETLIITPLYKKISTSFLIAYSSSKVKILFLFLKAFNGVFSNPILKPRAKIFKIFKSLAT